MDTTVIQIIWTVVVFILFIVIGFWAYSSKNKDVFEQAGNIPFDEDELVQLNQVGRNKTTEKHHG